MPLVRVRGRSMMPALRPGDFLWGGAAIQVHRQDIALIHKESHTYLKRIIGLPGEQLDIRGGRVFIEGQLLPEPYVNAASYLQPQPDKSWRLEPDTYIVLGDARDDSLDSRAFGPVSLQDIFSIIRIRLWPPKFRL